MDSNKSKAKTRLVEKISFSNHYDSDDEEDTLHYHRDNRIKATNISSEDYAFFVCAKSERQTGLELESHFESVMRQKRPGVTVYSWRKQEAMSETRLRATTKSQHPAMWRARMS